ncbi:MAG: hypothetical protein DELT_02741 [Desulfovibrio sp.]
MENAASWPPPFTVRISKRAKYARLRVSPGKGLEVVLPHKLRNLDAIDIVERHKDWVEKTLCRFEANMREPAPTVPETVSFHGGEAIFPVLYGQRKTVLINPVSGEGALHVAAPREDRAAALAALQRLTREYAYTALGPHVATIAQDHALTYTALRFRRQKSRWGSCSAKGSLSLNTCLVFLPQELARFVIMHELAHTKHMNHGQNFWKLLFSMEEKALALDKRLRAAWKYVPHWIWG